MKLKILTTLSCAALTLAACGSGLPTGEWMIDQSADHPDVCKWDQMTYRFEKDVLRLSGSPIKVEYIIKGNRIDIIMDDGSPMTFTKKGSRLARDNITGGGDCIYKKQ